jgi:hypothetical protein
MSQQPDINRTDVTHRVRGEVTEDCIVLTLNGREIGHVPFDAAACTMNAGYMVDQQRIFRVEQTAMDQETPSSYVDNCEMGWC